MIKWRSQKKSKEKNLYGGNKKKERWREGSSRKAKKRAVEKRSSHECGEQKGDHLDSKFQFELKWNNE